MPFVAGKTHGKKKEDAAQKIKEIKQRQQNWFKQREQSKNKEDIRPKIASAPTSSKSSENSRPPTSSKSSENSRLSISKIAGNSNIPVNQAYGARFKHWVKPKDHGVDEKEDAGFDDNMSICSGVESELARLVTPEQPVAEEDFGELAEKIACRVKNDLGLSPSLTNTVRTESTEITELGNAEHLAWSSEKCKTFTRDASGVNHFGASAMTSHNCTICKKVMLSSRNIPMMIIPCGHTLCKSCSEGRHNCPSCDCTIMSLTVNIMLQQVIQEFHTHPKPTFKAAQPQAGNLEAKCNYVEDNRRNRMASYTSQLANLKTRHDILSTEQTDLLDQQCQLTLRIRQSETQATSAKRQQEEVEKAISELQEKLWALQEHREQYETQTVDLTEEKSKVDGKLSMLSTTISSLVREIEKVALLAENENYLT